MNLPNMITMFRLFLVPCFFGVLYYYLIGYKVFLWWTQGLLVVIVLSDFLDGYLARTRDEVTELGKILDPISDKLFMICSFVLLSVFDRIPAWLTIIVVSKDVFVSLGWCAVALLYQRMEVRPSLWGKAATGFQFCTVCALILLPKEWAPVHILTVVTGMVTIIAIVDYAYKGMMISTD